MTDRRQSVFVKEDKDRRQSVFAKDENCRRSSVFVKDNISIISSQKSDKDGFINEILKFQKKHEEENLKNEE